MVTKARANVVVTSKDLVSLYGLQIQYRNWAALHFLDTELDVLRKFSNDLKSKDSFILINEDISLLCPYYGQQFSQELIRLHAQQLDLNVVLKSFLVFVEKRVKENYVWRDELRKKLSQPQTCMVDGGRQYIWSTFLERESALITRLLSYLRNINSYAEAKKTVNLFSPHLQAHFETEIKFEEDNSRKDEQSRLNHLITSVSNINTHLKGCVNHVRKMETGAS